MSPTNGLRATASTERDLKRRSTLDTYNLFRQRESPNPPKPSLDDTHSFAQRAASEDVQRVLNVVGNDDDTSDHPPPSPPVQNANPRTHKFSMLRWRHASDPQLSTKAREHAGRDIPPRASHAYEYVHQQAPPREQS